MQSSRTTLLYSLTLLMVGMGLGCAGLLLTQRLTTTQRHGVRQQPQTTPKPKLITTLLVDGEPKMGSPSAPLTIVEFSDFECPYCKQFHEQVLPKLKQDYVEPGLVQFIHKDLPLPFHQQARAAAAATRCASAQNSYWQLYGAIFDQQSCLACKGVVKIAQEQKLDDTALQACMQKETTQALINANISEAALHNIRATPTFVIGPTLANGKHEGEVIEGAQPWPRFRELIDQKLKALKRQ